jgi:RNA polymerase sigma factor (TIGR02999 family)
VSEFTHILERVRKGDAKVTGELLPIVYDELRRLAAQKMSREAAGHTLQPTALVHEAWLRLGGDGTPSFQNRAHFFGVAAEAMRRILIEHARRRLATKRGAGVEVVNLDGLEISSPVADDDQLLAVNGRFRILNCIDGSVHKLTGRQLYTRSIIGEAMQKKAFTDE